jgi:hypothetical protein
MAKRTEELVAAWRESLEGDPAETLARVVGDLAGCEGPLRRALARRFVAMVCGAGVEPARTAAVLRQAELERERAGDPVSLATSALRKLRERRVELEARINELDEAARIEPPALAEVRQLEAETRRKREREAALAALLREAGWESKEIAA